MEPESFAYAFGPFVLDRSRRMLWRDGTPVSLTPKAFDILALLVMRNGAVVEKDAIFRAVWPDTVVDEGSLTFQISSLRKALGERTSGERYIATIPGRGYQLASPVRTVVNGGVETLLEERSTSTATITVEQSDAWEPRARRRIALLVLTFLVLALAAFLLLREQRGEQVAAPGIRIHSLAVLPFKPVVPAQRNEALEIGMADTLITRLSHVPGLEIRPTSAVRAYGELDDDPLAAARELNVEAVLDGVIHHSGDRIRVTARLLRTADGTTLWARQFDDRYTDIFTVQDRITREVASSLSTVLTKADQIRLADRPTGNLNAYEFYLRGVSLRESDPEAAIRFYERALAADPQFAEAWAGIAQASLHRGRFMNSPPREFFNRAREAALKALQLDPGLSEAHAALGAVYADHDWAWSDAEDSYQRALELNPNSPVAHGGFALTLLYQRKFPDAIRHFRRAAELDPLSPSIRTGLGMGLRFAGRHDEAIVELKRTLELYPDLVPALLHLGMALTNSGRVDEGMAQLKRAVELSGNRSSQLLALYAYAAAKSGQISQSREILSAMEREENVASFNIALAYAALGDRDAAFVWLERAYAQRLYLLRTLHVEQGYEPLRNDPRYDDLIRRLGFEAEAK